MNNKLFIFLLVLAFSVGGGLPQAGNSFNLMLANPVAVADTLVQRNEVSASHIKLGTIDNILHLVPPEPSFRPDTNGIFFGLSSPNFPGVVLRFIYSGAYYDDNDSLINLKYRLIKKFPVTRINDYFNVWAYKVQPKHNAPDTASSGPTPHYTWLIFIDDNISYIQGTFTYPVALDSIFDKNMEQLISSIVNEPNPTLLPEHSVFCDGDYSLVGLQFVPQVMAPVAYFTEDAKPFKTTKHSRMFAVASPPADAQNAGDKVGLALSGANQILDISGLHDSVVVEHISETEINGHLGYCIRGSLQRNTSKRLILYYADDINNAYFLVLGLCNAGEEADFFGKIDKFRPTLKRHD